MPTFTADFFFTSSFSGEVRDSGVLTATLFDEDLIRGDDADERIEGPDGLAIFNGFFRFVQTGPNLDDVVREFVSGEATTTVTFTDGTTLSGVLGIVDQQVFNFGASSNLFLLDVEALASVGKTIADVAAVELDALVDHGLSYADLGFSDGPAPEPDPTPEPENAAPIAQFDFYQDVDGGAPFTVSAEAGVLANDGDPDGDALSASLVSGPSGGSLSFNADGSFTYIADAGFSGVDFFTYEITDGTDTATANVRLEVTASADPALILGTDGGDRLRGSGADETIIGGDGNDKLRGGGGADTFVFGADAADGDRDRDVIRDFDAAEDVIVLEAGAEIRQVTERRGDLFVQLEGDRDVIVIRDADASVVDGFVFLDELFLG